MTWIIIGVVLLIIIIVFIPHEQEKEHTYTASFGKASDSLSSWNHGIAVTGSKAITRAQSHTNVLLCGPTGSNKSTSVIFSSVRSLSRSKSSIVFNDVSNEIYDRTSAYLAKKGYRIIRIDFTDPEHSESFNPLSECRTISDIQKVSLLIVRNAGVDSKSDPFWEQSAIMLISLFVRYLVYHAEPEYRTLQNVLRLIERFAHDTSQAIDKLFLKTKDDELLSSYRTTLAMSDKTLQSVIATARTALSLWSDKEVCRTTATNTIDLNLLRAEPTVIYVSNPLRDLVYLKCISAIFYQSLFNFIISKVPPRDSRSIFILLDEFSIYRFPSLATTVSNIRKFNAGLVLCMQDEMALIANYGQAEAHQIKTNCGTLIYLKSQPQHICADLSKLLGKYTYTDEKGVDRVRELMTADEIRMSEKAIILINNKAPLVCDVVPFFKNIWLSHLSRAQPYPLKSTNPVNPPLISFE